MITSKLTGNPPCYLLKLHELIFQMLTSQGGANIATLHSRFNTKSNSNVYVYFARDVI